MILLAIIAGFALTLSLPPFSVSLLSFFALVPLFFAINNTTPKKAFKIGYIFGLSHFLTLLYWVPYPISKYGGLPIELSIFPYLILSMYMATFFAVFCFSCKLQSKLALLFNPCCWVVLEFLRGKLLTGFPWCLIGYSQYKNLHLIQVADITGTYGISFLIVLINTALYLLLIRKLNFIKGFVVLVLFIFTYVYGTYRLNATIKGIPVKAAIVQGNIDQSLKWNPSYQAKTMATYLELTGCAFKNGANLVIWPETSVPFYFQEGGRLAKLVYRISRGIKLIFGSPAYKRENAHIFYFNRAYLLCNGKLVSYYDKVHLVPFGEYVPLKRVLFFVNKLVPCAGDFSPGRKITPLKCKDLSAGVMICYEAIFPEIARAHVKKGANILVNISNDAWFGKTSAPYQHFAMSIFRAVENRRYLVRATNTGISGFIDPCGRVIKKGTLFQKQLLLARVKLVNQHLTIYTKYGDLGVYLALFYVIISFLMNHEARQQLSHFF